MTVRESAIRYIRDAIDNLDVQLKQEFGREWVEALRGDKYTQTRRYLKEKTPESVAHCCLGVACEIMGVSEWGATRKLPFGIEIDDSEVNLTDADRAIPLVQPLADPFGDKVDHKFSFPPPSAIAKFFEGEDNVQGGDEIFEALADLNDNGYSFEEIADVIEELLLHPQENLEGADVR